MRELTREEHQQMRGWFDLIDEDGGGTLDLEEISMLFEALQMDFDEQRVVSLLKLVKEGNEIDVEIAEEEDIEINFEEFVALMSRFGEELGKQESEDEEEDDEEEGSNGGPVHANGGRGSHTESEAVADMTREQKSSRKKKSSSIPARLMIAHFKRRKLLSQLMDPVGRRSSTAPLPPVTHCFPI